MTPWKCGGELQLKNGGVMLRVDRVRVLGVGTKGTMVVCVFEGGQPSCVQLWSCALALADLRATVCQHSVFHSFGLPTRMSYGVVSCCWHALLRGAYRPQQAQAGETRQERPGRRDSPSVKHPDHRRHEAY